MPPKLDPRIVQRLRESGPETAIGRARAFGIDVAALAIRLATTTPLERLRQLDQRLADVERIRSGGR